MRTICSIVFASIFLISTTLFAEEQEVTLNDIGVNNKYVCIGVVLNQAYPYNLLGVYNNQDKTTYKEVRFARHFKKLRKRIKRIARQIKRLRKNNKTSRIPKLKAKRKDLKLEYGDMRDCRNMQGLYDPGIDTPSPGNPDNGTENPPGGGGEDPGGDPGGDDPGGGDPPVVIDACEVVSGEVAALANRGSYHTRIINGEACSVDNSPVVMLILQDDSEDTWLCSGAVIDDRVVLTAAHCLEEVVSAQIITGQGTFDAESFAIHPDYDPALWPNDIGILTTSLDLPTNQFYIISDTSSFEEDELAVITGYGVDENGDLQTLKAAVEVIVSTTSENIRTFFTNDGDSTICNGDSGGPLLVQKDEVWVIGGINSYGDSRCGIGSYYYMNLLNSSYRNFIFSALG